MPVNLLAMRSDPEFKKASYGEQSAWMRDALRINMREDAEMQQYSNEEVDEFASQAAATWKPIMQAEDKNTELTDQDRQRFALTHAATEGPADETKYAYWLAERARAGDEEAKREGAYWLAGKKTVQESLVGKLVAGAQDLYERIRYADQELDVGFDPDAVDKLGGYFLDQLPQAERDSVRSLTGLAGGAAGLVENIALNLVFVGTAAAPGLLTKGLFGAAKAAEVAAKAGVAHTAAKAFASYGVEALGSATIDVLRSLPENLARGEYEGNAKFWEHTAKTFGEGIAFDALFNVAGDVVRLGLRPAKQIFFDKRFDLRNPESIQAIEQAISGGDAETIHQMVKGVLDGRLSKETLAGFDTETRDRLLDISARMRIREANLPRKFDSDEFLDIYAKASGYDIDKVGDSYKFLRDGTEVAESASRADAFSWVGAHPKVTIDSDDLSREYLGERTSKVVASIKGAIDVNKMDDDTVFGMLFSHKGDATNPKTVRFAVNESLKRQGFTSEAPGGIRTYVMDEDKFRALALSPPGMVQKYPNTVIVPRTMTSWDTRKAYSNYLTEFGRSKVKTFGNVTEELARKSSTSPESLAVAVKRLPGGTLVRNGDAWEISYKNADDQPIKRVLQSEEETSRYLGRVFVDEGLIGEGEIADQIYKESGARLGAETGEFGTIWTARDTKGGVIVRGNSIEDVLAQRPELTPKLPEQFGPDLYYLGGGNNFEMVKTVASGPYSDLLGLMDKFGPGKGSAAWKVVQKNVEFDSEGKEITKKLTVKSFEGKKIGIRYAVIDDRTGFEAQFGTAKETKEFMQKSLDGFEGVRRIANERGYTLEYGPSKNIVISAVDFKSGTSVKNLAEAREWIAKAPVADSQKTLFSALDPEMDEALVRKVQKILETDTTALQRGTAAALDDIKSVMATHPTKNFIDSMVAPAYSALDRIAERYEMPELSKLVRQAAYRTRALGAVKLKADRVIRAIVSPGGKMIDRNTSETLGRILQEGPDGWAEAAEKLGVNLTKENLAVLNGSKAYYERMGEMFGIDAWRYLSEYAPRLRATVDLVKNEGSSGTITKNQLMTRAFGPQWRKVPEMRFFAQHTRLDNFLDATNNRLSIVDQMVYYTEQGYKEQYLGELARKLPEFQKRFLERETQPIVAQRVSSFFDTVLGSPEGDFLDREMTVQSLAITGTMSKGIKALKAVFPKGMSDLIDKIGDSIVTPDLPGKASAMLTHATLGFRPFRAVSNAMQYMNTFAIFGRDAIMSAKKVTQGEIEMFLRKGIIQEKVFASSAKGIGEGGQFLEAGLKAQQQSEYLTRAWTAKAAGDSFDSALARLAAGSTNWNQFVKESRLSLLDKSAIDETLRLMKQGDIDAAKTLFQTDTVRIVMFDYAKENYPMAFKGVVGRAFGKFGIFPVGQIDLYRRIMESGDPAEKAARAIRLVASSVLIYNAFRQVGVDYSGFLWNDAFSFSGGPMFQSGLDIMNAGSSGPEGAMARRDLARSFLPGRDSDGNINVPRLVVPGALEINALIKASSMMQDDPTKGFLTALGATTTKDWVRGNLRVW